MPLQNLPVQNKVGKVGIAVLILLIVGAIIWYINANNDAQPNGQQTESSSESMNQEETTPPQNNEQVAETGDCVRTFDEKNIPASVDTKNKFVTFTVKNFGDIKMQLFDVDAPKTVENFLKLTQAGFYDCLTFHRVAKGFVIQGGDPKGDGTGGPGYTVPAEIKRNHLRGTVATARLGDQANPKRDSSGSQFFISLADSPDLDAGGYTAFGQVIAGMDVVDKIAAVEIEPGFFPGDGAPVEPVVITKAVISDK